MALQYDKIIDDLLTCDVLVVGGGPAGIGAAACAARNGAKTVLIERAGFVGGMATAGLVGPLMTCYDGEGKTQLIRGFFDELVVRMEKMGGANHPSKIGFSTSHAAFITPGHSHVTPFSPEIFKIVAEDMLIESGVNLLFYTQFVDCIMDGERISHVIVAKKEGLCAIKAKMVIDSSGDGDVAAAAGVPFVFGNDDGEVQPATMFFKVTGVDSNKVEQAIKENWDSMRPFFGAFHWLLEEERKKGNWKINRSELGAYETHVKGTWNLNVTRVFPVNPTQSKSLTMASVEGRKQVQEVYRFLKEKVPGFENAVITEVASVIGTRESRHVKGLYTLTREDILEERTFEDDIMICANSLDIHANDGSAGEYITAKNCYGIPYRTLVPQKCLNLLIAGKTISAHSHAAAAFRVMPCCIGIGQAAGTAAALCVTGETEPKLLDVKNLRETLISQDVFLNPNFK